MSSAGKAIEALVDYLIGSGIHFRWEMNAPFPSRAKVHHTVGVIEINEKGRRIADLVIATAVDQKMQQFARGGGKEITRTQGGVTLREYGYTASPQERAEALAWWVTHLSQYLQRRDAAEDSSGYIFALMLYQSLIDRINGIRDFAEGMQCIGNKNTFTRAIMEAFRSP